MKKREKQYEVVWKLDEHSATIFLDRMTLKELKSLKKDLNLNHKCYAIIDGTVLKDFRTKPDKVLFPYL